MTTLCLCFIIFGFMLQMWRTPCFLSHKNISPNGLFVYLIPLPAEKPLFKYLAVWESCQLSSDAKERSRLTTGVLLITLHVTYFSLATRDYKKKTIWFKWQGDYVIPTVNMSHPRNDDNDNGPHVQFNTMGWFFSNEFTSCVWHRHITSLRLTT